MSSKKLNKIIYINLLGNLTSINVLQYTSICLVIAVRESGRNSVSERLTCKLLSFDWFD
jgi:hypothetical protein